MRPLQADDNRDGSLRSPPATHEMNIVAREHRRWRRFFPSSACMPEKVVSGFFSIGCMIPIPSKKCLNFLMGPDVP
jgi:hypothetical protein